MVEDANWRIEKALESPERAFPLSQMVVALPRMTGFVLAPWAICNETSQFQAETQDRNRLTSIFGPHKRLARTKAKSYSLPSKI